jgi:hypothetical protein
MDDDMDDLESDSDLDIDSSGEIVYAMWAILPRNHRISQRTKGDLMLYPVKELASFCGGKESFCIFQVESQSFSGCNIYWS